MKKPVQNSYLSPYHDFLDTAEMQNKIIKERNDALMLLSPHRTTSMQSMTAKKTQVSEFIIPLLTLKTKNLICTTVLFTECIVIVLTT